MFLSVAGFCGKSAGRGERHLGVTQSGNHVDGYVRRTHADDLQGFARVRVGVLTTIPGLYAEDDRAIVTSCDSVRGRTVVDGFVRVNGKSKRSVGGGGGNLHQKHLVTAEMTLDFNLPGTRIGGSASTVIASGKSHHIGAEHGDCHCSRHQFLENFHCILLFAFV